MKANQLRKLGNDNKAFTFLVPLTIAIVVTFALLIVGSYIIGTIGSSLNTAMSWTTFPQGSAARPLANRTASQLSNFSQGYGDVGNIIKIVAIITAIGMSIMAIVGIATRVD